MIKTLSLISLMLILISQNAYGQHLFAKKYENCNTDKFCLDCGDTKVGIDSAKFSKMIADLNHRVYVNNLQGNVYAQVLVDSAGNGCVLSHSETKGLTVSEKMVWALNDFKGWKPAISDGKPEHKVSILFQFIISNGKISGHLVRMTKEMIDGLFQSEENKQ